MATFATSIPQIPVSRAISFRGGCAYERIPSRPPLAHAVPSPTHRLPFNATAVALTGTIWVKYSLDIVPVNYNLMAVNLVMAGTGMYQLYRKFSHEQAMKQIAAAEAK